MINFKKHISIGNLLGLCLLVSCLLWLVGVPFFVAMLPIIIAAVLMLLPLLMLYIYQKRGE